MKLGVKIMPREVILDTQGRAVEASLKSNGFRNNPFFDIFIAIGSEKSNNTDFRHF